VLETLVARVLRFTIAHYGIWNLELYGNILWETIVIVDICGVRKSERKILNLYTVGPIGQKALNKVVSHTDTTLTLPDATRRYQTLLNATRFYQTLPDANRRY
jgi:hypothetical protein